MSAVKTIQRKSRHELNLMRTAGAIVGEVHGLMREIIKPGMSTWELDEIAEKHIRKAGAIPTFKGYYGFPCTLCTSVNDEVVHGIPSKEVVLKEGDVISVDCGATYKGFVGDSAATYAVGQVSEDVEKLLKATNESLYAAIDKMREGNHLEDVSGAVEDVCSQYGYGLVRQYGGHGIGSKLHDEPFIHNYRTGDKGPLLMPGVTLAIEPMFNLGGDDVYTAEDQWTVITKDHLPSAHFEHTVLVTDSEPEVLTRVK
ncbi:MAG: type I methionyl aminopeptidase [Vampirovibrio sp.]|nr:type I methionyl aminopeptidase [Vampirovibrio sp.]